MDKNKAKVNLKIVLEKYHKYKNSDALEHESNAEKIIEDIFEKVLGWESLEDYIRKKPQKTGKFPDYTFRLNGINKFFLEAKKINASLDNIDFQKQAIGYARSSSVSFAVLTNFVEIRVYVVDREIGSSKNFEKSQLFKPILIENCLNENEFDKLWLFSKESFINKRINEFAEEICKLPKRKEIDKHLSEKLNYLREKIKKNIKDNEKQNNKIISDINAKVLIDEVTQRILDRLVFIRVCEDREFENRHLESFLNSYKENKLNLWKSVKELFNDYNKKNEKTGIGGYDSGLFENSLCDEAFLDENIIASIIEEFYYFDDGTPIDFSKIPADILGNLYENYLTYISKNIDTQKLHRKEQGIFYTPTYIVDYIVKNSIGELLKDKKINVEKIKILDPACGSGSFLIKTFDILNEHYKHKQKYDYGQKTLGTDGTTYSTKERILKNNIFGVDLDTKAVEIAQLNLLLRIAEKGQKLPLLQQNIKMGNSIIDDPSIIGEDKAFKWEEQFKQIIDDGGFDVIIGNPPYVFARNQKFTDKEKKYYYNKYSLQKYQLNTYGLFVEQAYKYLLKPNGILGFIIPNNWLTINTFSDFRNFILKNCSDIHIVNIYDKVFSEANVDTCILIFKKGKPNKISLAEIQEGKFDIVGSFKFDDFEKNNNVINIPLLKNKKAIIIMQRIEDNSLRLGDISSVSTGLKAYQIGKGIPKQTEEIKKTRKFHSKQKLSGDYYPYLEGKNVSRYNLSWSGEYLKYGDFLAEPRKSIPFKGERILVRQIPSKPPYCINAVLTDKEVLHDINSMVIFNNSKDYDLRLILGLINSKIISYWFVNKFGKLQRKLFPQFKVKELKQFPIPKEINKNIKDSIIQLVDKILSLNKRLNEIGDKKTDQKIRIEEEIKRINTEIDELVYDLYGLTEKEKEIIKKSS